MNTVAEKKERRTGGLSWFPPYSWIPGSGLSAAPE